MDFNNMDYSFFDLDVDDFEYEEATGKLTIDCKYRGEENTKIVFRGVVNTEFLSILPVHTIEYIYIDRDTEKEKGRFEIHLKRLIEKATVWADSVEIVR
ncbi:MAG: hypothetical protein J6B50_10900 [Lachnospiraceae bacterium]|nr:hypothetical protein [Lachnospiraceae bacterium]